MLILTRRIGEKVIIGNKEVKLTVVGVKNNQVKLGFEAVPLITIHREEIYKRVEADKRKKNYP